MSRTYRRSFLQLDCNCGAPIRGAVTCNKGEIHWNNVSKTLQRARSSGNPPERVCECGEKWDYYSKRNLKRDHKPWGKPPKWYKTMKKRERRAKERNSILRNKFDLIPFFRKSDRRDWD